MDYDFWKHEVQIKNAPLTRRQTLILIDRAVALEDERTLLLEVLKATRLWLMKDTNRAFVQSKVEVCSDIKIEGEG